MTTRRTFLSHVAAAPGILATGALWGDEPSRSAASHPGKARSVIFYYCKGGPSQAHTFDKPRQVADASLYPWKFSRCGQAGLEISDLFPRLQTVADDLCLVRSGYGAVASHNEAGIHIFTGASKAGASLGASLMILAISGSGGFFLIERAVSAGRPMGGHYVQGHVDARGAVRSRADDGDARSLARRPVLDRHRGSPPWEHAGGGAV